jgi:hypothetical protein
MTAIPERLANRRASETIEVEEHLNGLHGAPSISGTPEETEATPAHSR